MENALREEFVNIFFYNLSEITEPAAIDFDFHGFTDKVVGLSMHSFLKAIETPETPPHTMIDIWIRFILSTSRKPIKQEKLLDMFDGFVKELIKIINSLPVLTDYNLKTIAFGLNMES